MAETPIHKIQGLPPVIPGVISIKPNHIQQVAIQTVESVPLTQETVEAYWKEMIAALTEPLPQLPSLLQNVEVMLDPEKPNTIRLVTSDVFFDNDFKPMALRVLEFLRQHIGNPDLNYTVIVKTVKQEVINPYAPQEKYATMLETNPNLALLRKLFTDIDY